MSLLSLTCVLALTGCYKPYHEQVLVDIETNEVPFLINLEEGTDVMSQDSIPDEERQAYLRQHLVQSRRIEIAHRWKDTGHNWTQGVLGWDGEWIPTQRLILVDTSPEVAEWTTEASTGTSRRNEGIWVESSDSVGFSTGITVTARIESHEDAVLFLSNYPPKSQRDVQSADGHAVIMKVSVTNLKDIMDHEVRTRVQSIFADQAAEYTMDELREKKREIMEAVKEDVIPFFAEHGITITNIGQFGGFTYENPEIQAAIDSVFEAQQDEEVAKAEAKAAQERLLALQLEGEGEAARILEAKRGEAEGMMLVADAVAHELEILNENPEAYLALKKLELEARRLETWDGRYPTYLFQTGDPGASPDLLLNLPTPTLAEQTPQ